MKTNIKKHMEFIEEVIGSALRLQEESALKIFKIEVQNIFNENKPTSKNNYDIAVTIETENNEEYIYCNFDGTKNSKLEVVEYMNNYISDLEINVTPEVIVNDNKIVCL